MSLVKSGESNAKDPRVCLLREARNGSNSSLGQLLQSYNAYLHLMADEELGSDLHVKASPSDLVQDSFLEAQRDFDQFKGRTPEELQAWLRRLLLNNVANVIRSYRGTEKRDVLREARHGSRVQNGDRLAGYDRSPSSLVMQSEQLDALQAAMGRLPEHYRNVVVWRNYDRLPFDVIGERLERSAEAARKIWVRGIELLQQELDVVNDAVSDGPRRTIP